MNNHLFKSAVEVKVEFHFDLARFFENVLRIRCESDPPLLNILATLQGSC